MNDGKGNYDRISHPIAALTMMSYGLPQKVATLLLETLQKSQHHIKTGFGRTEQPVYGNETVPLSGIGQGNGIGPTLWALISSKLFAMMSAAGHGVHLKTSLTGSPISLVGFAFVDDTDLFIAGSDPNTSGEDLVAEFQTTLDRWAGGLIATGGALAPEKSFCYLIDFKWTGDAWEYRTMDELPGEFTLMNKDSDHAPLCCFNVAHADKTLGVFISMDGNEDAAKHHLKSMALTFGSQMRSSKCSKAAALFTLKSSFMKSIEYVLPVTQFSESEWNSIFSPALIPSLQQFGIALSAPRASRFGPERFQGFNIHHPFFLQQISHIMTLLQESVADSQTGKLLRLTAESLRLEIGIPFELGTCDYSICSAYTTDCWYKHLWEFVQSQPVSIFEDFSDPPLLCLGDQYIMQLFSLMRGSEDMTFLC